MGIHYTWCADMKNVIDLLFPKVISAACISMVCCKNTLKLLRSTVKGQAFVQDQICPSPNV